MKYIFRKNLNLFDNVDILSDDRAPDQAVVEEKEVSVLHPSVRLLEKHSFSWGGEESTLVHRISARGAG